MPEVVAGVLQALAGLGPSLLYLLAGITATTPHRFTALVAVTVLAAALAGVLAVRAARSQAQRRHGGALPGSRVQALEPLTVDPLGGGRNERHDTAA